MLLSKSLDELITPGTCILRLNAQDKKKSITVYVPILDNWAANPVNTPKFRADLCKVLGDALEDLALYDKSVV